MENSNEFLALRAEITARVQTLHNQLTTASILLFILFLFSYFFYAVGVSAQDRDTLLLLGSVVFSLLGFNYQANQLTFETIARYLREVSPDKEVSSKWEKYWIAEKKQVRLLSFLKTLPLLIGSGLPVVILAWNKAWPTTDFQQALMSTSLLLFALLLVNFRYKLRA